MGRVRVGTGGWSYSHWRGSFYPREPASRDWLPYYAEQAPRDVPTLLDLLEHRRRPSRRRTGAAAAGRSTG